MSVETKKRKSLKYKINSNIFMLFIMAMLVFGGGFYMMNLVLMGSLDSHKLFEADRDLSDIKFKHTNFFAHLHEYVNGQKYNVATIDIGVVKNDLKELDEAVLRFEADAKKAGVDVSQLKGLWLSVSKDMQNMLNSEEAAAESFDQMIDSWNVIGAQLSAKKEIIDQRLAEINDNSLLLRNATLWLVVGMSLVMFIILGVSLKRSNNIAEVFSDVIKKIGDNTDKINNTGSHVNADAAGVSEAAVEQASAIQETVATLNEISSMVSRNVDNARHSTQKAETSEERAIEGKKAMEEMVGSINEIDKTIGDIFEQIDDSNKNMTDIVEVIKEIAEKTNVINDIVFQTKLLSFNASVEAARAGEHGKGFAVVAEEVGNLAHMSGEAAKGIADMLTQSISQVNAIVEENQAKSSILLERGKDKITAGVDTANKCNEILDTVVTDVIEVKTMIEDISSATKEQADGISNIEVAMNELDSATHQNSTLATRSSSHASELNHQAKNLSEVIQVLEAEVFGGQLEDVQATEKPKEVTENKTEEAQLPDNVVEFKRKEAVSLADVEFKKAAGDEGVSSGSDPDYEDI